MAEETIPDMRNRIDGLEKQLVTEQKAREAAEGNLRLFEARDAFREAGYQPKHADLFIKSFEGPITPEAVVNFVDEFGLAPQPKGAEGEGTKVKNEAVQSQGNLSSFSRAGSGAGEGGQQSPKGDTMTRQAWEELSRTDPNAARIAVQKGLVQLRTDNPLAVKQ